MFVHDSPTELITHPTRSNSALGHVYDYWSAPERGANSLLLDMYMSLAQKFIRNIYAPAVVGFEPLRGRSAVYVGNHQTAIESPLIVMCLSALTSLPCMGLARSEVQGRWLHELFTYTHQCPVAHFPEMVLYLDRNDPHQVLRTFGICRERMQQQSMSVMVHVDGTRSLCARDPVKQVSSSLIDVALAANVPMVPFRLTGALPVDPVEERLHVPYAFGSQDIHIGEPIAPDELRALPYAQRRERVIAAINTVVPDLASEVPLPGDPVFASEVQRWIERTGASFDYAVLLMALKRVQTPCRETQALIAAMDSGQLLLSASPVDEWIAVAARRLFGPQGPRVVVQHGD